MKKCTAKKISTRQHLNNEFEVISIHSTFDLAVKNINDGHIIIDISNDIKIGDSINENGEKWESI